MEREPRWDGQERRTDPRIAGRGELRAAVLDMYGQARKLLSHAEVVNVSGGGLAFTSTEACEIGDTVNIHTADQQARPFNVCIVGASRRGDGRCELRGRLIDGAVPACLMYEW
jgi:hypothetical protein